MQYGWLLMWAAVYVLAGGGGVLPAEVPSMRDALGGEFPGELPRVLLSVGVEPTEKLLQLLGKCRDIRTAQYNNRAAPTLFLPIVAEQVVHKAGRQA